MVIYTTGQIVGVEGLCMLLSAGVSLVYREKSGFWLLVSAAIAGAIFLLSLLFKPKDQVIFAKEGFVTVALSWVLLSAVGALPFFLSREIPNYIDCFFETSSGLSTTGASIVDHVERLSHGILFWRSFTHWIGGMGVLVLVLAIAPSVSGRTIHMARAEMPGPVVGKLTPKIRDTAKILYIIYIVLTFLLAVMLMFGGMDVFESVVHAFGTAGTGGFGIKSDSIASYSPYIQWVLTIFMLVFSVNFNLYYMILIRRAASAFKSEEFWTMLALAAVSAAAVGFSIRPLYHTTGETARHSLFQVASILSTTGFTTANIAAWPDLAKSVLLLLMFVGGCAGSTAGGMKMSRVMLLIKLIHHRVRHMLHPRSVKAVKFEGKTVDSDTLDGVASYLAVYVLCIAILFLILSFEPFGIEDNLSAAVSTFNNVGPAYGVASSSYSAYSWVSKLAMSFAMIFGRLEIYPMLIMFSPSTWRNK